MDNIDIASSWTRGRLRDESKVKRMSHSRARQFHSVKIFIYPTSCRSWQILYRACNLRALILLFLSARSITVRDCRLFQRPICPSRGRRRGREGGREGDLLFVRLAFPELDPLFPKREDTPLTRALVHRVQFGKFEKITIGFFLLSSFFFCWRQKRNNAINATRFSRLRSRLDSMTLIRIFQFQSRITSILDSISSFNV